VDSPDLMELGDLRLGNSVGEVTSGQKDLRLGNSGGEVTSARRTYGGT
jgi:hypothetical protein